MVAKTLYLAWQDARDENGRLESRQWFPIGRLDVGNVDGPFRFRYTRGAEEAHHKTGFPPLPEFPDFRGNYESEELFPLFRQPHHVFISARTLATICVP